MRVLWIIHSERFHWCLGYGCYVRRIGQNFEKFFNAMYADTSHVAEMRELYEQTLADNTTRSYEFRDNNYLKKFTFIWMNKSPKLHANEEKGSRWEHWRPIFVCVLWKKDSLAGEHVIQRVCSSVQTLCERTSKQISEQIEDRPVQFTEEQKQELHAKANYLYLSTMEEYPSYHETLSAFNTGNGLVCHVDVFSELILQ